MQHASQRSEDTALIVGWRKGDEYIAAGPVDTKREVTEHLRALAYDTERRVRKLKAKGFSVEAAREDDEYFVASFEDFPNERGLRDALANYGSLPQMTVDKLKAAERPIAFYAVVLGNNVADRVCYVRKRNPVTIAKPGWLITEWGETLSTLEKPIFSIEAEFDLILRKNEIDVLSEKTFELMFYPMTGMDQSIESWIGDASRRLPMTGETRDLLVQTVKGHARMRRRLRAIEQRGHLTKVTMASFYQALRKHNYQKSRFVKNGMIAVAPGDEDILLKILNEDLYEGALTGERFAAERKSPDTS